MNEYAGDEFDDEGPQEVDLEELGGEEDPETVSCPNCGKDIYEDAERCPHCDEYVVDREGDRTGGWGKLLWVSVGACLLILLLRLGC